MSENAVIWLMACKLLSDHAMSIAKPKRMLLSIAGGSAAVLSMHAFACGPTTEFTSLPPGVVCEPLDGSLPDGGRRTTCNTSRSPGDASDVAQTVADATAVHDSAQDDAAGDPRDGGDAQ